MTQSTDAATGSGAASLSCAAGTIRTLARRAEFLACARARRIAHPGFVLQGRDRRDGDPVVGVGFTASKKVGNAVIRNRAKRRLRALAREVLPSHARSGWDYVLIARAESTAALPYDALARDLVRALDRLHAPRDRATATS